MRVFWEELGNDDANGVITSYQVCYKASENPSDIDCNLKKTIDNGGARDVLLDGLNDATTYNVAVKAATRVGFGNLGSTRSVKTNGARKYFSPGMLKKAYFKVLPSFFKKAKSTPYSHRFFTFKNVLVFYVWLQSYYKKSFPVLFAIDIIVQKY